MVDIRLLGRAEILVDDTPVTGDAAQRKRVLLLALLADSPLRPVPRDRIVGLLWPDRREEAARHLLSSALHVLRKALGPEVIVSTPDEVGLDPGRVSLDTEAFLEAVVAEEWARADELHRGPFLDGVFISEGNALDAWVEGRRRRYRDALASALDHLGTVAEREGRLLDAVTARKRLAALDPHSGRYALALMRALVAHGDRTAALRQARIHEQLLGEDFETMPDPEIQRLVEELRSVPAAIPAPPAGPGAMEEASPAPASPVTAVAAETTSTTPVAPGSASRDAAAAQVSDLRPSNGPTVVAVLPFSEPGADGADDLLGDGVAERILEELGRFEGVQVVSRSSSFAFREVGGDVREIAEKLGADVVLEGSIRRGGTRGRFWVQLVDATSGLQIWSRTYEHELGDIFSIQDDVGQSVATALKTQLRGERVVAGRHPVSLEAWNLYIRGRHGWHDRSLPSLQEALECFRKAIELDPSYAEAWSGVADVYSLLGSYVYGALPPRQAMPEARSAAETAMVLHPDLPSAHAALAGVRFNYDWDFEGAERSYHQALTLDPGNARARRWFAFLLAAQGRWEESGAQIREARAIDPISPLGFTTRAHLHYFRREFEQALDGVEGALKRDPRFRSALMLRALTRLHLGQPEQALREMEALAQALGEEEPVLLGTMALAQGRCGDLEGARVRRERLVEIAESCYVPPAWLLLSELGLGDLGAALDRLEEAQEERSAMIVYLAQEPIVDPLRAHPRFQRVLDEIPR